MPQFIASCAKGLEYLLVDELTALGANDAKEGLSQVKFEASWETAYHILMWSRVASRVFYPIATFTAQDDETLYQQASIIDWSQHIAAGGTFLVNAQSFRSKLSHTQFISQRIKDAIVDYFKDEGATRPDVAFEEPDVVIHCRVRRDQVTLSIDLAGVGLHHRGYRIEGGSAPIKENLAAALLMRAGWGKHVNTLYDPMCGSGTFLIEGAMMALDIAPGTLRQYLGLFGWNQFDANLWQSVENQAISRAEKARLDTSFTITGSDINPRAVRNAQMNVSLAGLDDVIKIHIGGLDQVEQMDLPENGLVIVNPPYSERLGEREEVQSLYHQLGQLLKKAFIGWRASILSPDKAFGHALGIRAVKIYKFNNGSIPCELLNLEIKTENFLNRLSQDEVDKDFKSKLSEQAMQLCNRLEKNRAKLRKYLQKENISCYRIYDADLPDYNAAIDVYADRLHIQEYRAPKSIDEKTAARRINETAKVAAGVFQLPLKKVFVKQRRQQKGDWQYQKANHGENRSKDDNFFLVQEGGRQFNVNMCDYLDTGLFLDHRKTRELVAEKSAGKRVLNLFCYTASVSVYAATAGAQSTTNVDLSRTYLDWAKRNFANNSIDLARHRFIREDCMQWLATAKEKGETFDLIFLDPPTFSNSKKMEDHFDVQKAHVEMIDQCVELLTPGGLLYFSNNFQKFEMQVETCEKFQVKEITHQTQTPDFARKNLHRCWLISRR